MARTGLYKSEVKKARDALLAQNKHPSVDAVRVELGNTGSKTTIHKYLRELEEESGAGHQASISEAIQDLVGRLAAQLQDDANAQIDAIRAQAAEIERRRNGELAAVSKELKSAEERLEHAERKLELECAEHAGTRNALNEEAIARHTAKQEASALKERLQENEAHRASLEEKHQHAREALEHYRQSVKEQRDQDARRQEQHVQQLQAEIRQLQQSLVVKQDDVTRLNQEGVRLLSELSHAQKALYDEKSRVRQLEQGREKWQADELRRKELEEQVVKRTSEADDLRGRLAEVAIRSSELEDQVHGLQIDVASSRAALEAHQSSAADLRAFIEVQRLNVSNGGPVPKNQPLAKENS